MKQGWIQVNNNNTQEPLAPKTMADMVYMDESQSQSVKEALLARTITHLTANIPASGWSATAPYEQTVAVAGLLDTDIPLVDVVLDTTLATRILQRESFGYVSMIITAANSITVTCDEYKPTADFALTLKVVR